MDLLLDTHTFLWFITGDKNLPRDVVNQIIDEQNNCFVSVACIWEIAIKLSNDKLEIRGGFDTVEDFLDNNDIEILSVNFFHIKRLLKLPHIHKDPFDRIIISQSLVDKMAIVTKDSIFKDYNVETIW